MVHGTVPTLYPCAGRNHAAAQIRPEEAARTQSEHANPRRERIVQRTFFVPAIQHLSTKSHPSQLRSPYKTWFLRINPILSLVSPGDFGGLVRLRLYEDDGVSCNSGRARMAGAAPWTAV